MSSDKVQILVVDDDISYCMILQVLLCGWGYQVGLVYNGLQVLEQIYQQVFDLVLCDICMVEMDGIVMLKEIKVYNLVILVLIMMVFFSVGMVVEVIKFGVLDYLVKLLDFDILQQMLVQVLVYIWQSESDFSVVMDLWWGMIGDSLVMQVFFNDIMLVVFLDVMVLIYGELGIGKELVVYVIYVCSECCDKLLVMFNCVVLNELLLELEFFGYEKGVFIGVDWWWEGCFVEVDGGMLFFDEIGDILLVMQVCLLWVIQEWEVQWVGSNQMFVVDVWFIVVIYCNLVEEVSVGCFCQDFYYCLNVVIIDMLLLCW